MNHAQHTSRYDVSRRAAAQFDGIEWEELPSFADTLTQRLVVLGTRHLAATAERDAESFPSAGRVWTETMPASLDPLTPSEPFRETMSGLVTREVNEPEVFRHFFGQTKR